MPKQFKLLLRRAGVKWVRGWSYKFIDMLLFVGAALVVGMSVLSVSGVSVTETLCIAVTCSTFVGHQLVSYFNKSIKQQSSIG